MNTQHTHHKSTNTTGMVQPKKASRRSALGLSIVVFLSSAALSLLLTGGTAQADALPPRPIPATPMPIDQPTDEPMDWSVDPTALPSAEKWSDPAAYIELNLPAGMSANAKTIVQWQDKQGGWHDVEGWQRTAASNQSVRWSVYPRDFGTGPFRWAVYGASGKGSQWVATSASFNLPCCNGNTLRVSVQTAK